MVGQHTQIDKSALRYLYRHSTTGLLYVAKAKGRIAKVCFCTRLTLTCTCTLESARFPVQIDIRATAAFRYRARRIKNVSDIIIDAIIGFLFTH